MYACVCVQGQCSRMCVGTTQYLAGETMNIPRKCGQRASAIISQDTLSTASITQELDLVFLVITAELGMLLHTDLAWQAL